MQLRFIILPLLFSMSALTLQAQEWVNGGNILPATGSLGTNSNHSLIFKTAGEDRGRITNGGNWGIGTASPVGKFHVIGISAFGNRATLSNSTRPLNLVDDNAVMRITRIHGSAAPAVELISRTSADGANVAYWDMYAQPSDKSFRIRDRLNANLDRLTVSGAGNVGIGTTSPSQRLHVAGNAALTGDLYMGQKLFLQNELFLHKRGSYSTFVGDSVAPFLVPNTNFNTGVGAKALYHLTTGSLNTAIGTVSLYDNTTGYRNTASGVYAMFYNTTGDNNTASGVSSLLNNTTGSSNTAVGELSLKENISGWGNSAFGRFADVAVGSADLHNATAIGFNAKVDASNKVRIGNTDVTSIGGQVGWTAFSDGRYKRNIREDVQGLSFINSLRPVTYTLDAEGLNTYYTKGRKQPDDEKQRSADEKTSAGAREAMEKAGRVIYSGFVAQEVEKAASKLGYEFSGVDKPQTEGGLYGLRYSDFVVPLVKAVQELSKKTEKIDALEKLVEIQQQQIDDLKQLVSKLAGGQGLSTSLNNATLLQNVPNPVRGTTAIQYSVPEGVGRAQLLLTDVLGRTIKTIQLTSSGVVNVNVSALSSGVYHYSLVANGQTLQTKKMTVQR